MHDDVAEKALIQGQVDHTAVHRVHARKHGDDVPRHPDRNVAVVVRAVRAAIAVVVDSPQPFMIMICRKKMQFRLCREPFRIKNGNT